MKFEFWTIGKNKTKAHQSLLEKYIKLCNNYYATEIKFIEKASKIKSTLPKVVQEKEGEILLELMSRKENIQSQFFLLDETGKELSSREFSNLIQHNFIKSTGKKMVFISGGAYGFSPNVYKNVNGKISLSKMTFPHDLVRVLFLEQLYRAFTILANEKYHN